VSKIDIRATLIEMAQGGEGGDEAKESKKLFTITKFTGAMRRNPPSHAIHPFQLINILKGPYFGGTGGKTTCTLPPS